MLAADPDSYTVIIPAESTAMEEPCHRTEEEGTPRSSAILGNDLNVSPSQR